MIAIVFLWTFAVLALSLQHGTGDIISQAHQHHRKVYLCKHLDRPQNQLVVCDLPEYREGQKVFYMKHTNTYLVVDELKPKPAVSQDSIATPVEVRYEVSR
jgi:hypothetical protein